MTDIVDWIKSNVSHVLSLALVLDDQTQVDSKPAGQPE